MPKDFSQSLSRYFGVEMTNPVMEVIYGFRKETNYKLIKLI